MHLRIETELEDDGRWIAEIPQLPGVLAYGTTAEEASAKAEILALRVLAERLEHGEARPLEISISLAPV
jgi:predicted RNase H-like HicB family nuclease